MRTLTPKQKSYLPETSTENRTHVRTSALHHHQRLIFLRFESVAFRASALNRCDVINLCLVFV